MKKRLRIGMLLMLALLMVVPVTSMKVQAKSKWYKKVMRQKKGEGFKYYKLLDINRDGKKELMLSKKKGPTFNVLGDGVEIWGRVNKKSIRLGTMTNSISQMKILYIKKHKNLVCYLYGSGTSDLKVYKFKKGKLKTVKTVGSYQPYHDPKSNGYNKKYVYRINGKKVSKKKAVAAWNKYYNGKKPLKFKKIK